MNFKFVYKVCNQDEWLRAKKKGQFNGSKKDLEDGYIHFSDKEQLKITLEKFFVNQENLILLKIETIKLNNLVYEQASDGNIFPHLYSPLDISFVSEEFEIILNEDGSYILPSNI
tara:strand:+ start:77 stop:421 length:345 start_codon:yes stop_codon:yes gene_type:complete